jgi:hypothetical protein
VPFGCFIFSGKPEPSNGRRRFAAHAKRSVASLPMTAFTWYAISTELNVIERGELDLCAALAIVDDYLARLKPKYDSGEEAHAQTTFGFSRASNDFIEICVISPQEILFRIELPRSPNAGLLALFRGSFERKRTLPSSEVLRH